MYTLLSINRGQRRFAIALGLSVLLHAWLLENHYGKGASRSSTDGVILAARILPAATEATTLFSDRIAPRVEERKTLEIVPGAVAVSAAPIPSPLKTDAAMTPVRSTTLIVAAVMQPSDPTYYAAGDLDVFPKALVKPDLSAVLGASHEPAAGKVRATVLIDEAGVVNAVRGMEASADDVATAARELLLRTRFTPARNKDGRIVKAQVLIALDYDRRAAAPISP